jgi:formylmethanofuran dehydrogenase subunit D
LFTVVFDQVMTDTAFYADVLLPATTFLEHYDYAKAYGPLSLQLARPGDRAGRGIAVEHRRVHRTRCAGSNLSRDDDPSDDLDTMLASLAGMPGAIGDELREHGQCHAALRRPARPVRRRVADSPPTAACTCVRRRSIAKRRSDCMATSPIRRRPPTRWRSSHPPATRRSVRRWASLKRQVLLEMNPEDAESRLIEDGDEVTVFNSQGAVQLKARVTPLVRPGTVAMPKGVWRRHTSNGWTSNVLVPDTLTDLGGGACFNDARVEVTRNEEAASDRPRR